MKKKAEITLNLLHIIDRRGNLEARKIKEKACFLLVVATVKNHVELFCV